MNQITLTVGQAIAWKPSPTGFAHGLRPDLRAAPQARPHLLPLQERHLPIRHRPRRQSLPAAASLRDGQPLQSRPDLQDQDL